MVRCKECGSENSLGSELCSNCASPLQTDVFISYSRKDYVGDDGKHIKNNIISQIKSSLSTAGISYWFDEEGIYSGDEFASIITKAIRNSSVFLFVSSKNSNASRWTSNEISAAMAFKKPIIPFRIDDSPYNDSVMMKIISLDYIECKDVSRATEQLIRAVRHWLPETTFRENADVAHWGPLGQEPTKKSTRRVTYKLLKPLFVVNVVLVLAFFCYKAFRLNHYNDDSIAQITSESHLSIKPNPSSAVADNSMVKETEVKSDVRNDNKSASRLSVPTKSTSKEETGVGLENERSQDERVEAYMRSLTNKINERAQIYAEMAHSRENLAVEIDSLYTEIFIPQAKAPNKVLAGVRFASMPKAKEIVYRVKYDTSWMDDGTRYKYRKLLLGYMDRLSYEFGLGPIPDDGFKGDIELYYSLLPNDPSQFTCSVKTEDLRLKLHCEYIIFRILGDISWMDDELKGKYNHMVKCYDVWNASFEKESNAMKNEIKLREGEVKNEVFVVNAESKFGLG